MIKLSNKILKYMVTQYKSNGTEFFSFDLLKNIFPGFSDDFLSKALYLLKDNGFICIFQADNVAYSSTLLPEGIRHCEENTLLKKGYTIIKAIYDLIH